MAITDWTVEQDGTEHRVTLVHGWWSGKREIRVDGEVVERSQRLADCGSLHKFAVGGKPAEIVIHLRGFVFTYHLLVDNQPVPSDRERAAGSSGGRQTRAGRVRDVQPWLDLARSLGLAYNPISDCLPKFEHRLVGFIQGRLVVVYLGKHGKNDNTMVFVIVRHDAVSDPKAIRAQMRVDPDVHALLRGKGLIQGDLLAEGGASTLVIPYGWRTHPVVDLAGRIQAFVRLVNRYTPALPTDRCWKCGMQRDPEITIINSVGAAYICASCREDIRHEGERMRDAYQAAPTRLGLGLLAGIGAATVGGLVWATAFVPLARLPVLNILSAFMGVVIFLAVMQAMRWARAKMTLLSTLLASVISLLGILVGFALSAIWLAWRQYGLFFSWDLLARVVAGAASSRVFPLILMLWLFTVLPYTYSAWAGARRQLSGYFSPKMEVLPGHER